MKTFTLLIGLILTSIIGVQAQAPNNGFYVNSGEKDVLHYNRNPSILAIKDVNTKDIANDVLKDSDIIEEKKEDEQFFKSSANPDEGKSWFRLSGSMGYSPILIGFVPGATDGYENTYDGDFISEGASIEFYSILDSYKLVIQGRSELQPNQIIEIPLGYEVTTAGDYTISRVLDYIDTSFEILLEDTLENLIIDLRISDYAFSVESPKEDNSRFIMHYSQKQTLNIEEVGVELNNINSFFFNDKLKTKVNIENSPLTIQIFDVTGKEILNTIFHESLQAKGLAKGIYIVKYNFDNSKSISKKMIKRSNN